MIQPNESVLRCIIRLKEDSQYDPLYKWIIDSYQSQLIENCELGPEPFNRWGQGKAQLLKEIVNTICDARLILDQLQKR
jgi:hypothetical protein